MTSSILVLAYLSATTGVDRYDYKTPADKARASVMHARQIDWRNGAVVYQVFVDRFAPSTHLEAKRELYAPPRSLHPWSEVPVAGHPDSKVGLWTHELAFWGGDIQSLSGKLDYVQSLGAGVLYLNPIQDALTNHKYDARDWAAVSPEYGTRQDVLDLAHQAHRRGMKLMLDGVFNHMGRTAPKFQSALKSKSSPYRNWFFIGSQYKDGYREWANVKNLAEVRLENPVVQRYLWDSPRSVVQGYLRDGVDGWRLDTAFELGPNLLGRLTRAAHRAKPGSEVVGEAWNYPVGWAPPLDGIMNFYARAIVLGMVEGKTSVGVSAKELERMVADVGMEPLLKSWLILDNHDTDRLASAVPNQSERHLAQVLQFTLPGSPVLYYGTELGMTGAGDPGDRAPMRWDLAASSNPELRWTKRLIAIHNSHRALKIGDYVPLDSEKLLAFSRQTDRTLESVFVFANPSAQAVSETVSCRAGRLMNGGELKDLIDGSTIRAYSGFVQVTVPSKSARVYVMVNTTGYSPYKRVY